MKSESTATIAGRGTEAFAAIATEVRAIAREHRLPKAFLEKTLDQLRDAVAMPPKLAAALVEKILAGLRTRVHETRKKRRTPRGKYRTLDRQLILAILGKTPGMTTSQVAREVAYSGSAPDPTKESKVSRQITHRSLHALLAEGLVGRRAKKDDPRRGWFITKKGGDLLDQIPEVKRKLAKGFDEVLALIEARLKLRDELLAENSYNWSYDQVRDVLPFHAVSYIRRQMAEVRRLERDGFIWSPSGVLWFRLGTEPRAMKNARIAAVKLSADPKVREKFVEAARENARREVFEKRKQGIARLHIPRELMQAYLAAVKNEPFYIAVHLAFSLRKMAKKGLTVTLGDLNGVLHQIRKEVQKRRRLPLDEDGEPRGPSPP